MKNLKPFVLVSLLLALAACGNQSQNVAAALNQSSVDSGIIGGADVAASDSITETTVGLIFMVHMSQATCTGTLVAPNIVLTAAHCVIDSRAGAVIFGTDIKKAADANQYATITAVFPHPDYHEGPGKNSNDIALVKFKGKLPAGYKVANLLPDASLLTKNLQVTLAGYGVSVEGPNGKMSGSGILRKVAVPLTDPNYSETEMLFGARDGAGACHGDSGGPAFATINGQTYVIGVTSRTTDQKGGCHTDSIYTNVAAFKTVIEQGISKLSKAK